VNIRDLKPEKMAASHLFLRLNTGGARIAKKMIREYIFFSNVKVRAQPFLTIPSATS